MKTSPFLIPCYAAASLLHCQSSLAAPEPPQVEITPIGLSISREAPKPERTPFTPFSGSGPSGGISILANLTIDTAFKGRIMPDEAKLTLFKDNRGGDLQAHDQEGKRTGMFGERFRAVSISPAGQDGSHQLQIRSNRPPTGGSTEVEFAGTLKFSPGDDTSSISHKGIKLEDNKIIELGAAKLKFTKRPGFGRSSNNPGLWFVQILPGPKMIQPNILLFGDDEDLPILNTSNHSNVMTSRVSTGKDDPFSGITARGFSCPEKRLSRIKVRFTKKEKLIEIPFKATIGMGDFGVPGQLN